MDAVVVFLWCSWLRTKQRVWLPPLGRVTLGLNSFVLFHVFLSAAAISPWNTQSVYQPILKELCQCLWYFKTHSIGSYLEWTSTCQTCKHTHKCMHPEVYKHMKRLTLPLLHPSLFSCLFWIHVKQQVEEFGSDWREKLGVLHRQKSFPLCWGGLWRVKPSPASAVWIT